jgi:hypothetical protein
MHRTIKFSKGLFSRYGQETVADKAAALSYYTIFSIGPLLFIKERIVQSPAVTTDAGVNWAPSGAAHRWRIK